MNEQTGGGSEFCGKGWMMSKRNRATMDDVDVRQSIAAHQELNRKNAAAARMQASGGLIFHLGNLVNRADSSDLEFFCKDEVRVQACRIFLIGRSEVFDKMLTNGMLETNSSIINVPEIPSAALLSILEFLYTGNIIRHPPADWDGGLEIIRAAHFFCLPDVDKIAQEFLVAKIADASANLQQIAAMLTTAMKFKNLSHDEDDNVLQLLVLLGWEWTVADIACSLSEEALAFILRHTRPASEMEHRSISSLDEYFRFRGLMLWCVCNSDFVSIEEANELVNGALPHAKEDLYSKGPKDLTSMEVTWLPRYKVDGVHDEMLRFLSSHQTSKDSAIRFLVHIDWVRMPPDLFVRLVEPLKLIPDSQLVDVFRFHSLRRPLRVNLDWVHSTTHGILSDGFVIQNVTNGTSLAGSAMCRLANRLSDELCIWRFIIEEGRLNVQLGFLCGNGIAEASRVWDPERNCFEALLAGPTTMLMSRGVLCTQRTDAYGHPKYATIPTVEFKRGQGGQYDGGEPKNVESFRQIEFRYHRRQHSCQIKVDSRDLGTVYRGLSGKSVFPVVSLGRANARVRLEIVSGFEII